MTNNRQSKEAALVEFLDECAEMLDRFTKNLTSMERGESTPDILAAIYRDMHTIKGSSHLFGFNQVGDLAHAMETCLDPMRKGKAEATPSLVDILYAGVDIITNLLTGIRQTKTEPDRRADIQALIPRLIEIAETTLTRSVAISSDKIPVSDSVPDRTHCEVRFLAAPIPSQPTPSITVPKAAVTVTPAASDNPGFGFFDDEPVVPAQNALASEHVAKEPSTVSDSTTAPGITEPVAAAAQSFAQHPIATTSKPLAGDEGPSETIRVQVSLLDSLMNLVGEQVLIRNQLLQHAKVDDADAELSKLSQRLNVLTSELQNAVMKTRMQPVGNVLSKFTRVVRDMGRDLGKKIELSIVGAETELDKTIIEAVKDPLTHIVRNAVDHGMELPAERKSAGKAEAGHLRIKAHHESGQVIIEITDDGRGIDPQIIGQKAVEKGLVTPESLARMSEREIQAMIFAPGFSTASTVSNFSGRGVGMDVVKTNIERIGGLVDLHSVPGQGTQITFKIPLTLAIVPALIVRALGQRFAIPQNKLIELVLIDESNATGERIEILQGSPVLRLRGNILPLVALSKLLANTDLVQSPVTSTSDSSGPELHAHSSTVNVVVLSADGFQFGLIVEAIEDTADIVVKALASFLKDISHFSGATILGDGSVALTIDVMGISNAARLRDEGEITAVGAGDPQTRKKMQYQSDMAEFLLVDVGAPGSYAIPLAVVARLEEFTEDVCDFSGEQKVVRYRDALLPIFSLPDFLDLPFPTHQGGRAKTPVVVVRRGDNLYGIEVFEICDVVSMPSRIDQTIRDRPGILGTMVAGEDVLVVVDILGMIDAVRAKLAEGAGIVSSENEQNMKSKYLSARQKRRILVVEDSSFFRNYIRQILEDSGFQVETSADGAEGWNTLEAAKPGYFSLVLTDIEMPVMDGFELATKIASDSRFAGMPLVAITTRFSNADIERGKQVGFTRYLEKLNAEKLLAGLDLLLFSDASEAPSASSSLPKEVKRATGY